MKTSDSSPFQTFWMAGFECSDQLNAHGYRVDLLDESDHLNQIISDYARLESFGLNVVREGVRWSKVERTPYHYDWSEVIRIMDAADRFGLQIIWDMCHFGYPDDLSPMHPMFARRFGRFCEAFARLYRSRNPGDDPVIVPINEVGFISWLGGEVNGTSPYLTNQGWEVKYHLMKAYIEGVEMIRRVLPKANIMVVEPLVNVTTCSQDPVIIEAARHRCEDQFQTIDILTGRICPELRGRPEYLDIMGFNYYFNNQWDFENNRMLDWHPWANEPMRKPLGQLLSEAHQRYGLPILITETSHPKEDRPIWMDMIGEEVERILGMGLPLLGVCLYPIIDRPDWDYIGLWHHSGLWDNPLAIVPPVRVLNQPYAETLLRWQARIPKRAAAVEPSAEPAQEPAAEEAQEPAAEPAVCVARRRGSIRRGAGARHKTRSQRGPRGTRGLRCPVQFRNMQEMIHESLQPQQPIPIRIETDDRLPGSESEEMEHAGMMDRD